MAKIRVYELARDLNLENKILLSKLGDLDITVKSHMSALDDETVAIIRQQLFGKKAETIEETRVKPTVIRRRKKVTVKAAPEPTAEPEASDAAEMPLEEVPEKAEPVDESAAAEEAPEAVAEETAEAQPADEAVAEGEVEPTEVLKTEVLKTKKPKKVVKKAKKEDSAKIIQLPLKPVEKPVKESPAKKGKVTAKIEPRPTGKPAAPKPERRRKINRVKMPRKRSGRKKAKRVTTIENF